MKQRYIFLVAWDILIHTPRTPLLTWKNKFRHTVTNSEHGAGFRFIIIIKTGW